MNSLLKVSKQNDIVFFIHNFNYLDKSNFLITHLLFILFYILNEYKNKINKFNLNLRKYIIF